MTLFPRKIHPTFTGDIITYSLHLQCSIYLCITKYASMLLRNPHEYKPTVFQSNKLSSSVSNSLKIQFGEICITKISLEGSLTWKYNDKHLNVNNINCIIIILFKRNHLLTSTAFANNGWQEDLGRLIESLCSDLLELENSKMRQHGVIHTCL